MKKIYEWIDLLWGLISETIFVRFEFDLPVETLRQMHRDGKLVFAVVHGGLIDWLVLSSWCRRQKFGAILVANRKRVLLLAKPLYFFQVLFRQRSYSELFLGPEPGPRLFFCPSHERKKLYNPTEGEKLLAEIYSQTALEETVNKFHIVPIFIRWRKHVRGEGRGLTEFFFGLASNPNWLGKGWYLFRKRMDSTVRNLDPFTMDTLVESAVTFEEAEASQIARSARRKILVLVFQEMRVVLGPRFQSPHSVKESLMKDPDVQRAVAEIAAQENVDKRKVMMRAYQYFTEIAANYTYRFIEVMYIVLTWLFTKVFEGMDTREADLQMVRETMKAKPIVFISCHRSHLDYMVVPYVLFLKDMVTPLIVAGINLAFWPVGPFLRMGGAFFIRRSFRGNPLYSLCLRKYIEYLLKNRFTIKFFIEGTRSRSGKMLPPAYGLLKMVLDSYRTGVVDDLALIPVSICYDEVLEGKSYAKELTGGAKEKESATGLLKSSSLIKRNIGKVYLRFAEPILAKEIFQNAEMTGLDPTLMLQKTAFQISKKINDATPVTPKSIVSSILLSHRMASLSLEEILRLSDEMAAYALSTKIELSVPRGDSFRRAIERTLRGMQKNGDVSVSDTVPRSYYCDQKKRVALNFSKNSAIHCFVIPSIALLSVAYASQSQGEEKKFYDKVIQSAVQLRNFLKFEFFFSPTPQFINEINDAVRFFAPEGQWASAIRRHFEEINDVSVYLALLGDLLESYLNAANFLKELSNTSVEKKAVLSRLVKHGESLRESGNLSFPESNTTQNYSNALMFFENQGFVKQVKSEDKVNIEIQDWDEGMQTFARETAEYLNVLSQNPALLF
jgi:glycerol-3-phosphate O-acyltransferase